MTDTAPEILLERAPEPEFIISTTANELLHGGIAHQDRLDLLDRPVHILKTELPDSTYYELVLEREPFTPEEFVRVLNITSSSSVDQAARGIEDDWNIIEPRTGRFAGSYDQLVKMHESTGRHWQDFLAHGPAFLDVIRAREEPQFGAHTIDGLETWKKILPKPVVIDEQVIKGYEHLPTRSLVKKLTSLGAEDVKEVLLGLIVAGLDVTSDKSGKIRSLAATIPDHAIRLFSRLPAKHRRVVQASLVQAMDPGGKWNALVDDYHGLGPARISITPHMRGRSRHMVAVIDENGRRGAVDMHKHLSKEGNLPFIPADYRQLVGGNDDYVSDRNGYFFAEGKKVDRARFTDDFKVFIDPSTIERVRDARIRPVIAWSESKDRPGEVEWDLRCDRTETYENGVTTNTYEDGLFGLIVLAYLSPDVRKQRGTVWVEAAGLRGVERKQPMGAAQLPLFALMRRNALAKSQVVRTVRVLAA